MNIQEQNVPQSYRDLLATIPEKSNFFYEYARRKKPTLPKKIYVIQGLFSLTRETDDRSEELIPTYQLLALMRKTICIRITMSAVFSLQKAL